MNNPSTSENDIRGQRVLSVWIRIYLHGVLVLAVLAAIGFAVSRLSLAFDFTGSRPVAITTAILAVLVGPPLLGSMILFGVFPFLKRSESLRQLLSWDVRLIRTLSNAESRARVVIVNSPGRPMRTIGVMTHTFEPDHKGQTFAVVYIATTPEKFGYLHVLPMDDIELTNWTLKQWQLYQFTYGAVSPHRLHAAGVNP